MVRNIKFRTEAYFDCMIEMTDHQYEKLLAYIGENKHILGNDVKAPGWIKFLTENAEFDYVLQGSVDIEEIEAETKPNYPYA